MDNNLKKLELDKILKMLANEAISIACREKIFGTEPFTSRDKIIEELKKTDDAFKLSSKYGTPRFYNIVNIVDIAKRAGSGSGLSLRELLDVLAALRGISGLIGWYGQCQGIENSLSQYFELLTPNKSLAQDLEISIISEEELSDNASQDLSRIRRAIIRKSSLVREELERITKSASKQKFLQESLVTMRDGRYVVPVKQEYKGEISGLVHDVSQSGATLFIEPMAVVEANNEIRVLKSREQEEVERIMRELSARVGDFSERLLISLGAMTELELYFSKALLGAKMRGTIPEIVDMQLIDFKKARHPLIDKEKAVPVSISLGEKYSSMVVTGPNTGGKTVALKTAGLLILMAQCGLMIPVKSGSKMGIFSKVLADLGDEQSIEQSLSTFSSHMNNIIKIISVADKNTLVLLDELGSGTDPVEGAALAVSIIDEIKGKGCLLMATTHYQEVKLYAIGTEGVENAACEFDVNTLKPTYNLIVGVPGKSNAFAIAKRLGLSDKIIDSAGELITGENKRFENIIEELEAARQELEKLRSEALGNQRESAKLREELQKHYDTLEKNKERELQNARNRSLGIINEVRFRADKLLEELEALKSEKDKSDFSERVRMSRSAFNKQLDEIHDIANPVDEKKREYKLPRSIKLYDTVFLTDIEKKGTVVKEPDKQGNCLVQVGIMKTKTNVKNLELVLETDDTKFNYKPMSKFTVESSVEKTSSMELDIRGRSADEALLEVDKFLDSSILSGLHLVTIIHGKGAGVLRAAVHQLLRGHKQVKSYRLGVYGEGETGVTVVEFK
ncbi:MAG: endonuclease MutS2 [Eubacterium sp.]|jgi:DNA mismatch repair protein MutS2|nr:endonuclease MutS2 [Eubacterium sp.]